MEERIQQIEKVMLNGSKVGDATAHQILGMALKDVLHYLVEFDKCRRFWTKIAVGFGVTSVTFMLWASFVMLHAMVESGWNPFQ